jgi:hypothetical protein
MPDFAKELSQEYWRPATIAGNQFQTHGFPMRGSEAFCSLCGTPYAVGARFCHLCGAGREEDLHASPKRNPVMDRFDLDAIRTQFGLSTISLTFVAAAAIFLLAALMIGLIYNTSTLADWQAVQTWRIEWLLATAVALLFAILFKNKP